MGVNHLEVMGFIDEGVEKRIFPLQTMKSMAHRWGANPSTVSNWSQRHEDFPKPIYVVESDRFFYPLFEVERYENDRGGADKVREVNNKPGRRY